MWPFKREQRAAPPTGALLVNSSTGGLPTWAGTNVDTDAAQRLSAVWACVRLLADTVSTLPVDVYRDGSTEALPTPPLLRSPAAGMPLQAFLEATMRSLLLRGNAYGLVTARSGATMLPAQVELLHPDRVAVTRSETGRIGYRIGGREYPREDVWHVRAFVMPGTLLGLSPVEYARQAIGLGLAAEKFGAQFFGDNATPTGILTTEDHLSQEQATGMKERWKAIHRDRREIAVLGNLKYTPISIAPDESQFVETVRANVATVARFYGVPPEMIGGEAGGSLTYANVEQRALDFLTYSLTPWLVRLETALTELLPARQYVKFNPGGLLRTSLRDRYEAHRIGIEAGFLTVDEARALEDLPALGDPS
jgi:HK97 family phage portal protein